MITELNCQNRNSQGTPRKLPYVRVWYCSLRLKHASIERWLLKWNKLSKKGRGRPGLGRTGLSSSSDSSSGTVGRLKFPHVVVWDEWMKILSIVMKQTRLTSSATLPGWFGGGCDGLYSSRHSWTHFLCKRKQNNRAILIAFLNLVHLVSRMNGSQTNIGKSLRGN